jgi:hypothetical protein
MFAAAASAFCASMCTFVLVKQVTLVSRPTASKGRIEEKKAPKNSQSSLPAATSAFRLVSRRRSICAFVPVKQVN